MSGYCKCGAYHEEDDARPCAQCADNAIDIEARQMFGKLAAAEPGSGPKLMVLRGVARELTALRQRVVELERYVGGNMLRSDYKTADEMRATIARLTTERDEARRSEAAIRELMNCYNIGGWTDAERLIKERDEARAALQAFKDKIINVGFSSDNQVLTRHAEKGGDAT